MLTIFGYLTLIAVSILLVLIIVLRKEILSFFNPTDYIKVLMIQYDYSIKEWIENKKKNFSFKFGDKTYNIYNKENPLDNTTPFKKGRLNAYLYFQNNEYPIKPSIKEFRPPETDYKEMLKKDIDGLWVEQPSVYDFLQKNLIPILIIIGIVIIVVVIVTRPAPTMPLN